MPVPALLGAIPALNSTVVQVCIGLAILLGILLLALILSVRVDRVEWKGASATFGPLQLPKPKRRPRAPGKAKAKEKET